MMHYQIKEVVSYTEQIKVMMNVLIGNFNITEWKTLDEIRELK